MEQKGDEMTFLKTFGFTISITILFCYLAVKPFYQLGLLQTLTVFVLIGLVLHYLFKTQNIEEAVTKISMIYLPASVMAIVFGITVDLIFREVEEIFVRMAAANGLGSSAHIFPRQNIALALIALFAGLFGPIYLFRWKEAKTAVKQVVWDVASILVIYALAFVIHIFIIHQFFGARVLT